MMTRNTLRYARLRMGLAKSRLRRALRCTSWTLSVAAIAGCHGVGPYSGETPRSSLDNTYWQLVRIAGRPIATNDGGRQPYILLTQTKNKVHGFAGCNNLSGRYHHDGQSLQFKQLANTRMACQGNMSLEQRFLEALRQTQRMRISNHTLTLLAASGGKPLAQFDARIQQFQNQ